MTIISEKLSYLSEKISWLGLLLPFWTFIGLTNLYKNHNKCYLKDKSVVNEKVDGFASNTTVKFNDDGSVNVERHSLFCDSYSYTDENGDGCVESVYIHASPLRIDGKYVVFYRDKHIDKCPKIFERADRDFRKQLERFGFKPTSPLSSKPANYAFS